MALAGAPLWAQSRLLPGDFSLNQFSLGEEQAAEGDAAERIAREYFRNREEIGAQPWNGTEAGGFIRDGLSARGFATLGSTTFRFGGVSASSSFLTSQTRINFGQSLDGGAHLDVGAWLDIWATSSASQADLKPYASLSTGNTRVTAGYGLSAIEQVAPSNPLTSVGEVQAARLANPLLRVDGSFGDTTYALSYDDSGTGEAAVSHDFGAVQTWAEASGTSSGVNRLALGGKFEVVDAPSLPPAMIAAISMRLGRDIPLNMNSIDMNATWQIGPRMDAGLTMRFTDFPGGTGAAFALDAAYQVLGHTQAYAQYMQFRHSGAPAGQRVEVGVKTNY